VEEGLPAIRGSSVPSRIPHGEIKRNDDDKHCSTPLLHEPRAKNGHRQNDNREVVGGQKRHTVQHRLNRQPTIPTVAMVDRSVEPRMVGQ